jgi:lipopolysaccharide transport system permease protein
VTVRRSQPFEQSQITVIEPVSRELFPNFAEVWRVREMFLSLVRRDITVRYSATLLGALWVLLQPVSQMLVLSMVFGFFARLPTGGIPYSIFVFAGLVPYLYFSKATSDAANSLLLNQSLVKKIYFPRIMAPVASVVSNLVDLGVMFAFLLFLMLVWYNLPLTPRVVLIPGLVLLLLLMAFGLGAWFAALSVKYRDANMALPTMLTFMMYLSPVIYPASLVPAHLLPFYVVNPMVGIVEGFRWALFGSDVFGPELLISPFLFALVLVTGGAAYFRKMDGVMSDVM